MRNAFAAEVTELAKNDPRVVLLSGDIGNRLFDTFKDRHPDRFYNCGVAEANMIGLAAGMAMNGLRPVAYTITPFITTRCLEQIRVDVCYHDVGVTIVGVGAGLAYASLGPTHHSCEDMAFLRALPNMAVLAPGDAVEVRLGLQQAVERGHGTYMRLGKKGEAVVHKSPPEFAIGKAITVRDGAEVCLLSTGNMLPEYLQKAFKKFALVATAEEHSLIGGFGAAVAEWLAEQPPQRAALVRFGTADVFHHESGEQEHARHCFGLTAGQMAETIRQRVRPALRATA
jgi:transketolase